MISDDMALVREFAASQSEPAFAALVQRHLGLVHSAALRQVGDADLAKEIAQAVFIILARKAPALGPKTVLSAWLYRTTRYAAADALKARRRRQAREQEAYMQSTLNQPDVDTWAQVAPLLDDAMAQLGETDRAALVLRYFENKTMGEIAVALRMQEAAAQKRVARALEKLRALFGKRGVTLSATIIAGAVAANSVQAAPIGLVTTIVATSVKGSVVAASITALVKGTLNIMAWIKTKTVIALGVGTLLAGAAVLTVHEQREQNREQEQKVRAEEQEIRKQAQQPGLSDEERQKLEDRLEQLRAKQGRLRARGDKLRQQEADLFRRSSVWLSPFTKVRFDGDKVLVTYSGAEYELAVINGVTTPELLAFCRTQYQYSWQIRVAEDLVVVLDEMKHPVNAERTVSLTLIDARTGAQRKIEHAAMTAENRKEIYNARVLGQESQLQTAQEKFRRSSAWLSPFTKVQFDGDKVLVTYSGAQYELAAINDVTTPELLGFCRAQYKDSWQKRLAEDLVIVLEDMKHPVNAEQTVSLTLINTKTSVKTNIEHAAMTAENRRSVKNALVLDLK